MTVPGMAESIQDLMNRYVQGREVPYAFTPVYEEHLNVRDVRVLDKTEKEMYRKQVHKLINDYQAELQKAEKKKETDRIAELERQIKEYQSRLEGESS